MMFHKTFSILVVLLFVASCGEKALNPRGNTEPDFSITPMENEEAELAALHLSGELIAPVPLYNQIKDELELIRDTWSDSITHVNLVFKPYWTASKIKIYVPQSTYDSMNSGQYHHWDSLNDYYRIDTITFGEYSFGDFQWANLYFKGKLNPLLLVDNYAGLPGFRYVNSVATSPIGDRPLLLLLLERRTVKYFFRHAYGDCPAGCIHSEIHYFTVVQDSAIYNGSYFTITPDSIPPIWLDTVRMAFEEYYAWNQWPD